MSFSHCFVAALNVVLEPLSVPALTSIPGVHIVLLKLCTLNECNEIMNNIPELRGFYTAF